MTKHPFALAIALALVTSATLCGCDSTSNLTEQEHIQRAKDFEDKGKLKEGIIELKNALEKNPQNAEARLLLGHIYIKSGEGAAAEQELLKARELGVGGESILVPMGQALLQQNKFTQVLQELLPTEKTPAKNKARILQLRGDAQLKTGKLQAGCELYEQSLAIDSNLAEGHVGLAKCAAVRKDYDLARTNLSQALQLDARNIEARLLLGDIESLLGNRQQGIEAYAGAVKIAPYDPIARYSLAMAQMNAGKLDDAQKEISLLRKQYPQMPAGFNAQAILEYRRHNFPAAAENAEQALRIFPDAALSTLIYGASQYQLGHMEQANTYLNRIVNMQPGNLFARKLLASTLLRINQPQRAMEVLKPALAGTPEDSHLLALLAQAYLQSGDDAQATELMEKAMALAPKSAPLRAGLGIARVAGGDTRQGLGDLEAAAEQSGSPYQTDLVLVGALLAQRDYPRALAAIGRLDTKLPNNPVVHKLMGTAFLGKGDRANARKSFEKSLALNSTYYPAALALAKMDIDDGKPEAARKRYQDILAADSKNMAAMMALAEMARREGQPASYAGWLEKARAANPKALAPRVQLAWLHLGNHEPEKAIQVAREAETNRPGDLHALDLLGAVQLAIGQKDGALSTFTKMTALFPNSPLAHYRLASIQSAIGQLSAAITSANKALNLNPNYRQAQLLLASLQVETGKIGEAVTIARRLQAGSDSAAQGHMLEGDLWLAQKQYSKAAQAYTEVLKREPSGSAAMRKLHAAMTGMGDGKAADIKIAQWLRERPNDTGVRQYYAESLFKRGRFPEAVAEYQRLLAANPKDVVALNNLAELYRFQKNPQALQLAERAYSLQQDDPNIADTLGWMLVETGNVRRALPILKQAVAKAPNAVTIRYHLAVAYEKSGDRANARKELEKVLRAKTSTPIPQLGEARKMLQRLGG